MKKIYMLEVTKRITQQNNYIPYTTIYDKINKLFLYGKHIRFFFFF